MFCFFKKIKRGALQAERMVHELSNIQLLKKIAQGAFGEIYECVDLNSQTKLVIKIEKTPEITQLRYEYLIYRKLTGPHTPQVYEFGQIRMKDQTVNCMTMELLGQSLEKLLNQCNKAFSEKTVFMLGKACINRIEMLHHKHFIHRDIKPDNFVTDTRARKIFLIDYGLSKYFRNPRTLVHIPMKTDKNLTGTARYASLNTHRGIEQARRDDLEGLGFMLIYFLRGRLPWQGLRAETRSAKYERIMQMKERTTLHDLCRGLPNELYQYMVHVRNLGFEDTPDYAYLESLFEKGLRARGLEDDGVWDWLEEGPPS